MLSRKVFYFLTLIAISYPCVIHAQVPDRLKNPYWDLVRLNNSNQYQTAILQGKILVAQEPQFSHAYAQLATAFEKAERIEQGLAYFDSLRQASPDNPYVHYTIAVLEKSRKNFEKAIGSLKICIKLKPKYERAYFLMVNVADSLRDLEIPRSYFRSLLQEDSLNAAAHYGLGCISQSKKEWADGANEFAKAIEINPELVHAYYLKGLMHANQRDYQKALETWNKGTDVAARLNDIELQGMMTGTAGTAYHELRRWQEAIANLEKALQIARDLGDRKQEEKHLSSLAAPYAGLGKPKKALELYREALAIARGINDRESEETVLGSMSSICNTLSAYSESIRYGTTALKMAEARGDSGAVAKYCLSLAGAYGPQAQYELALQYSQRALNIRQNEAGGDRKSIVSILNNMGMAYKEMGDIPKAIETFDRALTIARAISNPRSEMLILGNLGYAYSGLSEYSKADDYFHQALDIAEQTNDLGAKGLHLGNIGVNLKKWGNFTKALRYMQEALDIHRQIPSPRDMVRHYANMANIYEIRGDYVQALDLEKKALAISDSIGTRSYTVFILRNLGVAYEKIGDFEEALRYCERALKLAREIPVKESLSSIHLSMGVVHENKGNDRKALQKFKESLQSAQGVGNQEDEIAALTAIGDIHARKKQYSNALKYYNEALTLAKNIGQKNQEGRLYLNMGTVHLEKGDLPTALPFFEKALNEGTQMDAFDLSYESLGGIAAVEAKQKRYDEAIEHYDQAIEKIESVRERLRIESYKTTFMESKISIYESIITLLIRLKRFEDAYEYLQRFRARSFLDILSPERIDITEGISTERFERYRFWEQKLRETYERLGNEYDKSEARRDRRLVAALADSLQKIRQEHEKILDEIRLHHPRYAELTGITQPLSLQDVQRKVVQSGMTVLEYFVGPEAVAAWVIQSDTFYCEVLQTKRGELGKMVEQLRQPFKDVKEGKTRNFFDVSFDLKLAQRIYERIFQPIEKHLAKNNQLLIVPDGILHYLPFEALVTRIEKKPHDPQVHFSRYENAHYLIEKYPIAYAPSASISALERSVGESKKEAVGQLLAFGNPDYGRFKEIVPGDEHKYPTVVTMSLKMSKGLILAPLSDRDVREVSKIMQPATVFLDKEATEDRFKENAARFPDVYVSSHAIVDESRPLYSLIAFAQDDDPKEDGFLHTYEVFNLHLNADLVTLSACETGLGKLSRGEGFVGLTHAFLYAGARSVLVSLWSVDESTSRIMKDFYQNLKKGMTKTEALRQAKMKLIKTRDNGISFSHPFLWAPFVLVGAER